MTNEKSKAELFISRTYALRIARLAKQRLDRIALGVSYVIQETTRRNVETREIEKGFIIRLQYKSRNIYV